METKILSPAEDQSLRARKGREAIAAAAQRDEDFVRLMRAEWGRRLVWSILEASRTRSPKFDTNSMIMARQVGVSDFVQRHYVDRIFELCPDLYATMKRENA